MHADRNTGPTPRARVAFERFFAERAAGGSDAAAMCGQILERRAGSIGLGIGSRFGPYRIDAFVGGGGQGQVHAAIHEPLQRRCALKILHAVVLLDATARERFVREGRLAARIDHPGVCRVHESGVLDGVPFLATEWIDGEPLGRWLARLESATSNGGNRGRELTRRLDVAIAIGDALVAAHAAGVLHRDVKPSNILVRSDHTPVVVDFGLAGDVAQDLTRLTRTGQVFGTPGYMAPEQLGVVAASAEHAARIDVFSYGVVTYELVTGRRPFAADSRLDYENALRRGRPEPLRRHCPDASDGLATVLERALALAPTDRFATVAEFVAELRRCRAGDRVRSRRIGYARRIGRWLRREPLLASALLGALLALAIGLVVTVVALHRVERAAYVGSIAAAGSALQRGDVTSAGARLADAPAAQRAFEWSFLRRVLDPATHEPAIAWSQACARGVVAARLVGDSRTWVVRRDGEVALWLDEFVDGAANLARTLGPFATGPGAVTAIAAERRMLFVGGVDGHVTVHGFDGTPLERTIRVREDRLFGLAAAPDGAFVAMGLPRDPLVLVAPDADVVSHEFTFDGAVVRSFALTRTRLAVVTAPLGTPSQTTVHLRERDTGAELGAWPLGRQVDARSPVVTDDDVVFVPLAGGGLACLDTRHASTPRYVVAHAAALGALLDIGNEQVVAIDKDGRRATFDAARLGPWLRIDGGDGAVQELRFDAAGNLLAVRRGAGNVQVHELERGGPIGPAVGQVLAMAPHGSPLALATPNSVLRFDAAEWHAEPVVSGLVPAALVGRPPRLLAARPRAAGPGLEIVAVTARGEEPLFPWQASVATTVTAVASRGSRLAALDRAGQSAWLFDCDSADAVSFPMPARTNCIALDAAGDTLLVGGGAGELTVIGANRERRVMTVADAPLVALAMFDDGSRVAVADAETLHLVDPDSGEVLLSWPVPGGGVRALAVALDGRRVAVGLEDGSVLVATVARRG